MKVVSHILCNDNGIAVKFRKSPNVGGTLIPAYLIIHYDASKTAEGAISWMTNSSSKVSAHLHIDREGNIVQMVPFNKVAWHAGKSHWEGLSGMNSYSIGIELQNTGIQEYTQRQMDSLIQASKAIHEAYKIKEILGHSDIAPGRKIDPGAQFPMGELLAAVYEPEKVQSAFVNTSELNVRSGAGVGFPVIDSITMGEQVNILQEKDNWSEVFICSRKLKGWVSNKFLK